MPEVKTLLDRAALLEYLINSELCAIDSHAAVHQANLQSDMQSCRLIARWSVELEQVRDALHISDLVKEYEK